MIDHDVPVVPAEARERRTHVLPGVALAGGIAVVAVLVGKAVPVLGGPVTAIVIGALLSGIVRRRASFAPGISLSAGTVLQVAVVTLGAQLSLRQIASVGLSSLPVMLGTLAACLIAAYLLGRRLGIDADLTTLIGVGTGICGASAIAAVSPVIRARSSTVAYAISTIFCFNVAAVLLFPPLGHLLGLSQSQFGLFAGTAVNDTSSVVAAATSYGAAASHHAVVVKLTRTLMIIPVSLALGAIARRRSPGSLPVPRVPWFLVAFVVVSAVNSVGVIPAPSHPALQEVSAFLITMALAAIGLSTDVRGLRAAGLRPLALGAMLWVVVGSTSLLLQLVGG